MQVNWNWNITKNHILFRTIAYDLNYRVWNELERLVAMWAPELCNSWGPHQNSVTHKLVHLLFTSKNVLKLCWILRRIYCKHSSRRNHSPGNRSFNETSNLFHFHLRFTNSCCVFSNFIIATFLKVYLPLLESIILL